MKTIVLRFGEAFAPECGTIVEHQKYIDKNGYVWFGKMGLGISSKGIGATMSSKKILLVHSGKFDRYWLTIESISNQTPNYSEFPSYYHDKIHNIKSWIKIIKIELAETNVISKCSLISNNRPLAEVSKSSISPYYIVHYDE